MRRRRRGDDERVDAGFDELLRRLLGALRIDVADDDGLDGIERAQRARVKGADAAGARDADVNSGGHSISAIIIDAGV